MSEFSTIVSDRSVLFVGSQICVKSHSIFNIIIAPKAIMEDVELFLDEFSYIKKPKNLMQLIRKCAKDQDIGPFTIITNKVVMSFGIQEAMRVPKLDYLIRHRLKSLLGLNPKIWLFDAEHLELLPFKL